MKAFKLFAAALVAFGMFSCSSDNDGPKLSERVDLTVKFEPVITTRGDLGQTPDNYVTKIEKAYAYVVDAAGKVLAQGQFSPTELTDGKEFTGLTTEVADVMILANWPSSFTPSSIATGNILGNVELAMSALVPVYDNDPTDDPTYGGGSGDTDADTHGVKYAALYNVNTTSWSKNTVPDPQEWTATVTIAPLVTRFEIGAIAGTAKISDSETQSGIYTFTLAGVYMNNVYTSVVLGTSTTAVVPGATLLKGTFDQSTVFPVRASETTPWSHDMLSGKTGARTYAPTNGAWAYHVAPIDASSDATKVPQIILHLKDVVYGDAGNQTPAAVDNLYVPVVGFNDGTSPVTKFERGNVYKITSLEFNRTHPKTDIDPSDIKLIAKVQVQGWKVNPIYPEF